MKHMSQEHHGQATQRRLRPLLAVAGVFLLGLLLWVMMPAGLEPAPSGQPSDAVVVDDSSPEGAASADGVAEAVGTVEESAPAEAPASEALGTPAGVDGNAVAQEDSDRGEFAPDTPAAQAYSPEADAAVEAAGTDDTQLAEHVAGEVLLSVPEGTTRDEFEAMVYGLDFLSLDELSDSDLGMGFAVVSLRGGISVAEASTRLQFVAGIEYAEPDYILTVAEDFDEAEVPTGQTDSAAQGESTPAEDPEGVDELVAQGSAADDAPTEGAEAAQEDPGEGDATAQDADVIDAAADSSYQPTDPGCSQQWALDSINAYSAWGAIGYATAPGGNDVGVAIIDTGALTTHEDLDDNILPVYYNSYTQSTTPASVQDTTASGHGTHVAGIIAAEANGVGTVGVAFNAKLLIIKASQDNTTDFTKSSVVRALGWLLEKPYGSTQTRAQQYNIRVVNLSMAARRNNGGLNVDNESDKLLQQIGQLASAGVLTVCAAGNDASSGAYAVYPGDYAPIMNVIGLKQDGGQSAGVARSAGSNYNEGSALDKDISAPGTSIYSTLNQPSGTPYTTMSGTSMAAPMVSGVAALLFAVDPSLTMQQATDILTGTARTAAPLNNRTLYGSGEVDALAAVQLAMQPHVDGRAVVGVGGAQAYSVEQGSSGETSWTWSSSNAGVATIDANGMLTGVAAGTVTIIATPSDGSAALSYDVTVLNPALSGQGSVTYGNASTYTVSGSGVSECTWLFSTSGAAATATSAGTSCTVTPSATGTLTVTATCVENPDIVVTTTTRVDRASIAGATVSLPSSVETYTGSALTPTPTVRVGGRTLVRGTDFTVSYSNNVRPGTATVTVTGRGNYTGTARATFTIRAQVGEFYSGGSWYYRNADGSLATGWVWLDAGQKWVYYDARGRMLHGQAYVPCGNNASDAYHWYYFDDTTGATTYGWKWIADQGKWVYYEPGSGWMAYGEVCVDGEWYYLDPATGARVSGWLWLESGQKWVYYDTATGAMLHGQAHVPCGNSPSDEPHWYYFDEWTGATTYGWKWIEGQAKTVYYLPGPGWMVYGWQVIDGQSRYLDPATGALVH